MRATRWYGRHDLRVEEVPDPHVVNPHDVVVRVTLSAICGSDLHLYNGVLPGMKRGDVIGHEFMGEVIEAGPEVAKIAVGDRVVVMSGIACGRCWHCSHQRFAWCSNTNPAGSMEAQHELYGHGGAALYGYSHMFGGYAGGQAELVRVPFADVNCLPVRGSMPDERVLFVSDILPTAWMAVENCDVQPGDTVAIFGAGPVGLLAVRCARLMGAEQVIAIDAVSARLDMAGARGGAITIDERDGDVLERLDDLTGGRGPDACIDAVGLEAHDGAMGAIDKVKQALKVVTDRPAALRNAILACRTGGTVSIPGVYAGMADQFPIGAAFGKGLTFKMGQTHFHRYAGYLLDRIEHAEIDPSFVITHRVTLDDVPDAYAMFNAKADGCVKVVVTPS